jgi:hypothetical protein
MPYVLKYHDEEGEIEVTLPSKLLMPNGEERDVDANGFVTMTIPMSLFDTMQGLEVLNDETSQKLAGSPLVEDISYKPIGVDENGMIQVRVTGNVLFLLREEMGWKIERIPESPKP